eukprot:SAG31_NODE_30547_length_379_cov_1.107143_1_plen_62_part_10
MVAVTVPLAASINSGGTNNECVGVGHAMCLSVYTSSATTLQVNVWSRDSFTGIVWCPLTEWG